VHVIDDHNKVSGAREAVKVIRGGCLIDSQEPEVQLRRVRAGSDVPQQL